MKKIQYIFLLAAFLLGACNSDDVPVETIGKNIEIAFTVPNYTIERTSSSSHSASLRAEEIDPGTTEEQQITDLYLFLFPGEGNKEGSLKKYYLSKSGAAWTVTEVGGSGSGSYAHGDKKITLNLSQADAGKRDVYIVGNCGTDLKEKLEKVKTLDDLQGIFTTVETPWSPTLTTPILMSGNKEHDFVAAPKLEAVALERVFAKLEINVTLSEARQSTPTIVEGIPGNNSIPVYQYRYKLIDFNKNSYVLKSTEEVNNLHSTTDWLNWYEDKGMVKYTLTDDKVTNLNLVTYLNTRKEKGTTVELIFPYQVGILPPPEFGEDRETYKIILPVIERNHWYVYDVEI